MLGAIATATLVTIPPTPAPNKRMPAQDLVGRGVRRGWETVDRACKFDSRLAGHLGSLPGPKRAGECEILRLTPSHES